jgi:hypothetical protein
MKGFGPGFSETDTISFGKYVPVSIDYYMGSPMAKDGHPERASRTPRVEG